MNKIALHDGLARMLRDMNELERNYSEHKKDLSTIKLSIFLFIASHEGVTAAHLCSLYNLKAGSVGRHLKSLLGEKMADRNHSLLGWIEANKEGSSYRYYLSKKGKEILRHIDNYISN